METEIIDKLYLELSQVTKAVTKREILLYERIKKLESAINGALEIKDLWIYPNDVKPEFFEEAKAVATMHRTFDNLIFGDEALEFTEEIIDILRVTKNE